MPLVTSQGGTSFFKEPKGLESNPRVGHKQTLNPKPSRFPLNVQATPIHIIQPWTHYNIKVGHHPWHLGYHLVWCAKPWLWGAISFVVTRTRICKCMLQTHSENKGVHFKQNKRQNALVACMQAHTMMYQNNYKVKSNPKPQR
jgi:hypothetical protein